MEDPQIHGAGGPSLALVCELDPPHLEIDKMTSVEKEHLKREICSLQIRV